MKNPTKKILLPLAVLVLLIGAAAWTIRKEDGRTVSYHTVPVTRGDLLVSISATGTVEPEEVIDVGAQIAGQILAFGKDANGKTVDYGSPVEEGTVLARIDDSLYAADEAQAAAQVQAAEAGVQRAKADLGQMQAKLQQAERDWKRAQKLGPSDALAQSTYDAYQSAYESAKANVAVGEATILQAQADLAEARAGLLRARRNLGYCTITSPVKGVIIDRRVNIGQTVVASLNAPSLFLIAKDLHRMQVWVAVNEADIGQIKPGQPVRFTVDAFPGETFRGEVGKVRLNASMTQNVVTYTVEIITDNSTGRLLPYLTANVQFELKRADHVLMVPNAALKWKPSTEQVAPEFRKAFEQAARMKEGGLSAPPALGKETHGISTGTLWVLEDAFVKPLPVRLGINDGTNTQIESDNAKEGLQVITGIRSEAENPSPGGNPFTPQFMRRSKPGGSQ